MPKPHYPRWNNPSDWSEGPLGTLWVVLGSFCVTFWGVWGHFGLNWGGILAIGERCFRKIFLFLFFFFFLWFSADMFGCILISKVVDTLCGLQSRICLCPRGVCCHDFGVRRFHGDGGRRRLIVTCVNDDDYYHYDGDDEFVFFFLIYLNIDF